MFKFFTREAPATLSQVPAVIPTPSPKQEEPVRLERIHEPGTAPRRSGNPSPYDARGNYTGNPADLVQQPCDGYRGDRSDYGYVGTHNVPDGNPGTSIVVRK
jgi:hypothetical protein